MPEQSKREIAKNRIKAGSKGGPPGVWSARKAQLLGTYCKANGCSLDRSSKASKSLQKWQDESWKTSDGSPSRKEGRKTVKRYRPARVWDSLNSKEIKSLDASKTRGDRLGKSNVSIPKKLRDRVQPSPSFSRSVSKCLLEFARTTGARDKKPRKKRVDYRGRSFPGYNKPIPSDKKGKKKMVLVKKGDQVKLVHYGAERYKHNYSAKAKKSYLARSGGIRNKSGELTKNDKFSPNFWARRDLWPKRSKPNGSSKW